MESISAEQVRARVRAFWDAYCGKAKTEFEQFYFSEATVMEIDARRIEPARLMMARRLRELFSSKSSVGAKLGFIDVQVLEPGLAVAYYGFHFHVVLFKPNGKCYESDMRVARATQIFQRDEQGALRIIHEHMSAGEVSPPKELPDGPQAKG